MSPKDIMTVPKESDRSPLYFPTGNEYLSLPEIHPRTGAIQSLNVLHMGSAGLLEFRGTPGMPLLAPFLTRQGRRENITGKMAWCYLHDWIPAFTYGASGILLKGEIFCPPGHRGGLYRLTLTNTSHRRETVEMGFELNWQSFNSIIFSRKRVPGCHRAFFDPWTQSLILEARSGLPLAALALGLADQAPWHIISSALSPALRRGGKEKQGPLRQPSVTRARSSIKVSLDPGASATLPLYMAVNMEGDGGGTTVVDLRRHGHGDLWKEATAWLEERSLKLEEFQGLANKNLFFNYFFAAGRTLDTDQWVPVTSRSPRYYVSAAFWSRDTLLWSFPGLLLADPPTARAILLRIFDRHMERAGEHAHYINGSLLYPGFELDQLSAHALALDSYVNHSGDGAILRDERVRRGLETIIARFSDRFDSDTGLYSTFLDPSDDPVKYPFLIYGNALAQRALHILARYREDGHLSTDLDLAASAASLKENIYRLGIMEGPFGPMFAWAVDGRGNAQMYDNPPGSLQLLAHYGFCSPEEPVFMNTCRWVNSSHNPYFHGHGHIKGAASRHAANPWPLGAANDLLALNLAGGSFFRRAFMDNGFCCETVDPVRKGRASTGFAFASAAGFLAHALWKTYGAGRSGSARQATV